MCFAIVLPWFVRGCAVRLGLAVAGPGDVVGGALPQVLQPGDVAVIGEDSLGIVQGENVYLFGVNEDGTKFGTMPFTVISRAFRT